ncbi:MAG: T9SS type A sorting domain-containing protein, partial [bacterium]
SDASDANFAVDSDTPGTPGIVYPKPDTAINNPSVVFRWRSVRDTGGIDYYTVQVACDSGFQVMVDTARRSDTTFARVLAPDTCYFWRVRATDRVGLVGQWSQPARFEIDARTPGVPTPLEPVADTWLRSSVIAFRWTEVQLGPFSPVSYVLSVDTQAVGIDLWVDTTRMTSDTLVLPWQRGYWWQVRAFDRAGNQGAVSAPQMFGVDTTRPPTPVLVFPPDSGIVGRDTVSLTWRSVADNASGLRLYHVQVARDTGFVDTLAVPSPIPLDTVRHVTLSGGVVFYWRVRAIDRAGHEGLWSPRRSFALVVGLAGQVHESAGQLRLPTHVRSSVRLPGGWRARLLDATGRLVAELAPGSNDVRHVEPGVYFIRASCATGRTTVKVVLTD